jgi:hypothetical protein
MYERMLNKAVEPSENDIINYLGEHSLRLLKYLESHLEANYKLVRELRFPFGNNYGWGYKYSHNSRHLCYLFFEREGFTVLLQINGNGKEVLEKNKEAYLQKTLELWEQRYPCGGGGWVNYRPSSETETDDIIKLLEIKVKPKK